MRAARIAAPTLLAASALLAACGDDGTDASAVSTTTAASPDAPEPVLVTGVDYGFEGVPATLARGQQLSFVNASDLELHELVAFRLPDGEQRSVPDLLALPPDAFGALVGAEPATVLLAAPGGGPQIPAVGDGTLEEPGRYLLICAIPTGADPAAYLEAAATSDGPPQVPGGAPHFTAGMATEVEVS